MSDSDRLRWETYQQRWRAAAEAENALRFELARKHGSVSWARKGDRARLDLLYKREERAGRQIMAFLDTRSLRNWRRGCPYWWICSELTYDDAVSTGRLSVLPPLAYGQSEREREAFCAALEVTA